MSTIRYTAGEDYAPENSREAIYTFDITDDTADYVIRRSYPGNTPNDIFSISFAGSNFEAGLLTADSSRNVTVEDGVLFDFSTLTTGTVQAQGGDKGDLLLGGGSSDILAGEGGDDSVAGGGGDDILNGGRGADVLNGDAGDDTLVSSSPDPLDTLNGGAGDDLIIVAGRWATIDGGDGFDRLLVRSSDAASPGRPDAGALLNIEKVVVASGIELNLSRQSAIDGTIKINSRDGASTFVTGTDFDDRIIGGVGNDFINGGGGHDRLTGGQGADFFDLGFGKFGGVITDFSGHDGEGDLIGLAGGTPATFVESFSGEGSSEVRAVTLEPGVQRVLFDSDGDGRADVSFQVNSTAALTVADFLNASLPDSANGNGFVFHPAFAEALHTPDIAGLV